MRFLSIVFAILLRGGTSSLQEKRKRGGEYGNVVLCAVLGAQDGAAYPAIYKPRYFQNGLNIAPYSI